MRDLWDVVIVGAGPAGSAAALAALQARPRLRVLLLDRSQFPRDKACGDGVAPHVLDVLAAVGVEGLLDDKVPVRRLELRRRDTTVSREMARPAYVVPRTDLDDRLLSRALAAGADFRRQRVRTIEVEAGHVVLDGALCARTVIGADGAHSVVRRSTSPGRRPRRALALRGYAPVREAGNGRQTIVFGPHRQPSYAWSFDRGDGLANVGYGELLRAGSPPPTRTVLLHHLERLLPGSTQDGTDWRGHHLPLSSWSWHQPSGRVLLVGDAAHLVNPITGEGIYYAVATGVLAGRSVVSSLQVDDGSGAGLLHRRAVQSLLGRHLRHTSLAARLNAVPALVQACVRAAAREQRVFDQLVEVGLGNGLVTPTVLRGLGRAMLPVLRHGASPSG